MKVEFLRWGNSLALRVPKAFAEEIGAVEGKRAEMTADNGVLVVKVAKPRKRRRYNLEHLINGITEENRQPEIDWGPPVGNEVW
ncbi:MAG: AbrB/MazE/SpoVT family DNA-binding domain-containing protein [Xanthobacteraceae bacterium]|jgi:antitoxin MazE